MITTGINRRRLMLQSLSFLLLYMMVPATAKAQYERLEAPFGDKVSERIPSYHRAAPTVGTAGPLGRLGIIEAKAVGFRSILNLAVSTTAAGLDDASQWPATPLCVPNIQFSMDAENRRGKFAT